MKQIYYFILLIVVLFVSCSRIVDTTEYLYLCNTMARTVTLRLFKGDDVAEYNIEPDDTVRLATIKSSYQLGVEYIEFPPTAARIESLCRFDSATIKYGSHSYSFTKNETIWMDSTNATLYLTAAYPINRKSIGDYSYYTYDEEYFEFLERELKNKNYDPNANNEIYFSYNLYLINLLESTVDLEVFKENELSRFKLTPKDTIYFTTLEWTEYKGEKNSRYQGWVEYELAIASIDSVNLFYKEKKYTYTASNEIDQLFALDMDAYAKGCWISCIDENKKQKFGWE